MKIKTLSKLVLLTSIGTIFSSSALASEAAKDEDFSLEELMNTQIYSASKRPEKISEAAASVYVITSEDIKKAGVTSIPEALRLAPGVQVAQSNANTWAISIRGSNTQYNNKLLVLIDGRSVYTPLFSGVYWDSQDYILEDIDRIEVIKGPGGALWGANAVNGVINIITKEARKTQGNYASMTYGSNQTGIGEYRYGGKAGEDGFYRAYTKLSNYGELSNSSTFADNDDDWSKAQGGFRYDFRDSNYNKVTLQADIFDGKKSYPWALPTGGAPFFVNNFSKEGFQGANTMLNWNITTEKFNTDIKAYIDYTQRNDLPVLNQKILTQNLDVQTQYNYGIHSFMGGGEIRYITDNLTNSPYVAYSSSESSVGIFSTFLQDKIALVQDKLFLTIGSKFDYSDYTNFEIEPNARISYQMNDNHSVWASISKAIRTPTRGEDGFSNFTPSGAPIFVYIVGNHSYQSEELTAYELGYRGNVSKNFFFDVSAFYNDYSKLKTGESSVGAPPIIINTENNGYGETYGFEAYGLWGVTDKWDIKPGYTFLIQNFHLQPGSNDTYLEHDEERSPENQFSLGSYVKVAPEINWDTHLYYVSNLHYFTGSAPTFVRNKIDAYARLDTQIRWQVIKDVELSLIGQNLLDDQHQEFNEVLYSTASEIPRAVMARATFKF